MADTPRVTVPVEPTEAMLNAGAYQEREGDGTTVREIWSAMLSAAPAPEGGAVEATGARAVIRNGQIVISIDVDALPLILSGSIALNTVAGTFKVTDAPTFAKEVCHALNAEKEDGTTRVHMMFDSAFNHAIDQGAEGVEEISEDEFEAEASRLQAEAASALATREEAPAEAGEAARIVARHLPLADAPDTVCLPITVTAGDLRAVYAALRAQPQAREDTKACYDCATDRPHRTSEACTHPTPDALRVKEAVAREIKAWADTRWPKSLRVGSKGWVNGLTNRVLAALQAEQKGGA